MPRPSRLSDAEIHAGLAGLTGWNRAGETITKTFTFAGFPDAVAFVTRLVEPAERLEHHPDLDLRYNRVIVALSTHDQGGLTAADFTLAGAIEKAAQG
jgi:4a-hydroxytetrahydrobiopterin dehydratase